MSMAKTSKRKPTRTAIGATAIFAACAGPAMAQTWVGGAPYTNGYASWSDGANWSTGLMPNSGSNVVLGSGFSSGQWIHLNNASRTVNSLTIATTADFPITGNTAYSLTLANGQLTGQDGAGTAV